MKNLTPPQKILIKEVTASENGFYYNIRQTNTVNALIKRGLLIRGEKKCGSECVHLAEAETENESSIISQRTIIYPKGHHKA